MPPCPYVDSTVGSDHLPTTYKEIIRNTRLPPAKNPHVFLRALENDTW